MSSLRCIKCGKVVFGDGEMGPLETISYCVTAVCAECCSPGARKPGIPPVEPEYSAALADYLTNRG